MKDKTYEDKEYWDRIRRLRDSYGEEHVTLDGINGENEFDVKILEAVKEKRVMDVGCGVGLFTLEVAKRARKVVGVDFSEEALTRARKNQSASGQKNIRFEQADASNLPFNDAEFDVVVSRRGPVTDNRRTLSEAYRVLKGNGRVMETTIGEKDKENLARIFGRGQMYSVKERVAVSKERLLRETGFREIEIMDYIGTEIFESMKDLIIRLKSAPIIPDFDVEKDKQFLTAAENICKTSRGVETPIHRVTIIARK